MLADSNLVCWTPVFCNNQSIVTVAVAVAAVVAMIVAARRVNVNAAQKAKQPKPHNKLLAKWKPAE